MARRARRSGLLPTLSLRARRGQGVDLSAVAGTSNSLRTSTGDDLMLEATLSFDLSLLIHAPAEVTIARAEQDAQDARRELLREVVALYFERRRIQLQRALGPGDRIALLARQREIEALLDAFTNGAFRRMINGSVNRPDGKPKTAQTP